MVVVHAPDHIEAVARDIDGFGEGIENERIERAMRIEDAAVHLGIDCGQRAHLGWHAPNDRGR